MGLNVKITVYASSSNRIDKAYKKAAFEVGVAIAKRGWLQINGGGNTGLMCAVSDGALSVEGRVKVVILEHFREAGYLHPEVTDVVVEDSMPGRKKGLYELGDAYLAIPGGLGTLEEIIEVMSWRQLGFHEKPIAFLNTKGFWTPTVAMIERMIEEKFVAEGFESTYFVSEDIQEILKWMEKYKAEKFDISSKV